MVSIVVSLESNFVPGKNSALLNLIKTGIFSVNQG